MDYRFERPLGRGGMGEVWAATHVPTGQPVALKVLLDGLGERAQASLVAEVRTTARLDHPNVVVILDQGVRRDGRPWLAMERADADLKRLAPRTWGEARTVLLEILSGLAHIHARGLIHRDLKPENVLTVSGRWKIADLGIAHAVDERGPTSRSAGSPSYMAPEQLKGQLAEQGPGTDLYALGCLAWELAHGAPPFLRGSLTEIARAHLLEPLPPFRARGVPPAFAEWCERLLQKDPERRPAFAADARAALLEIPADAGRGPLRRMRTSAETWFTESSTHITDSEVSLASLATELEPMAPAVPPRDWRSGERASRVVPRYSAELALAGLRSPPLFGREDHRDALWTGLTEVRRSGRAALYTVRGPTGSGRSALVRWLAEFAVETGAAHVCVRAEGRTDALPDFSEPTDRPWVVVLDDPGDVRGTRVATQVLAGQALQTWPALFVAVADPELEGLDALVASAGSRGHRVELEQLGDDDIEALIDHLLRVGDHTRLRILDLAAGSPAVAVQAVAALTRSGALRRGPDGWFLPEEAGDVLGDSVESFASTEIDALLQAGSSDDRELLFVAAALQAPETADRWERHARALGLEPSPDWFVRFDDLGLLVGTPQRWAVVGGVRARLRRALGEERWKEVCAAAADLLAADREGSRRGLLLLESGRDREALDMLDVPDDGDDSFRRMARWYEGLLDAVERLGLPQDDRRRARLLQRSCVLLNRRGQIDRSTGYANRLLELSRAQGWPGYEAEALRELGSVALLRGEPAMPMYERAWALAQEHLPPDLSGNIRLGFIRACISESAYDRARSEVDAWMSQSDPTTHAGTAALRQRSRVAMLQGDLERAYADNLRAIELDEEHGRPRSAAFSYQLLSMMASAERDADRARQHAATALERFREQGNLFGAMTSLLDLATADLIDGSWTSAGELISQAVDLSRALGNAARSQIEVARAELALASGQGLSRDLHELLEEATSTGTTEIVRVAHILLAEAAVPDEALWIAHFEPVERAVAEGLFAPSAIYRSTMRAAAGWRAHGRDDLAGRAEGISPGSRARTPGP